MINTNIQHQSLKEIVTADFQAAAVFEKYSLDFCCRGGKTIEEACAEKGIDPFTIITELSAALPALMPSPAVEPEWAPDTLIEHIVARHHAYVLKMVPVLFAHTHKVASVHGANHPETAEIARHFELVAQELLLHMKKEEQLLFPYVLDLHRAAAASIPLPAVSFGSVQNPIRMMEAEHLHAGDEMYAIRHLSGNYTPPDDACTTFRITYQELQDFERDLHRHIHLENNILFPMAVRLEQELQSTPQTAEAV
jgi:regulator of cell morphogenesis and NO signaling